VSTVHHDGPARSLRLKYFPRPGRGVVLATVSGDCPAHLVAALAAEHAVHLNGYCPCGGPVVERTRPPRWWRRWSPVWVDAEHAWGCPVPGLLARLQIWAGGARD
jgi:hypothetical protein